MIFRYSGTRAMLRKVVRDYRTTPSYARTGWLMEYTPALGCNQTNIYPCGEEYNRTILYSAYYR
jgi:hypothetical protein